MKTLESRERGGRRMKAGRVLSKSRKRERERECVCAGNGSRMKVNRVK